MAKIVALSALVLLGVIGFSAYAYTVYLPSISTASPGKGTLNIYLADPPSSPTMKYLLVNVTSVTLKYSSNITETTTTSSESNSTATNSATSTSETTTNETGFVNRYVYNVSASVGTNVNLTNYQGTPLLLGSPKVPTGNVTGIILDISGARAFWTDGNSTQLKMVANGKLMVNVQFTIQTSGATDMNISITPASVHVSQGDVLRPVLLVTVTRSGTSSTETATSTVSRTESNSTSSSTSSQSSA